MPDIEPRRAFFANNRDHAGLTMACNIQFIGFKTRDIIQPTLEVISILRKGAFETIDKLPPDTASRIAPIPLRILIIDKIICKNQSNLRDRV